LIELGGLLDMTEWMRPYLDKLNKPVLQGASKEGKYYCMPWDIGPVVLFYRRDVLKAAGLSDAPDDVSKAAATWDDFRTRPDCRASRRIRRTTTATSTSTCYGSRDSASIRATTR
jgi:spermidine/putrescine-binding protein